MIVQQFLYSKNQNFHKYHGIADTFVMLYFWSIYFLPPKNRKTSKTTTGWNPPATAARRFATEASVAPPLRQGSLKKNWRNWTSETTSTLQETRTSPSFDFFVAFGFSFNVFFFPFSLDPLRACALAAVRDSLIGRCYVSVPCSWRPEVGGLSHLSGSATQTEARFSDVLEVCFLAKKSKWPTEKKVVHVFAITVLCLFKYFWPPPLALLDGVSLRGMVLKCFTTFWRATQKTSKHISNVSQVLIRSNAVLSCSQTSYSVRNIYKHTNKQVGEGVK